jgi:uncharacterized repeat protein (TIGR01451 family)
MALRCAATLALLALTSSAQAEGLPDGALQQITALRAEKANRTPAQLKMDSQLVYALKQSRNEVIAPGVNLRIGVAPDSRGMVKVDLAGTVTPPLLDFIAQSGGEVLFTSETFASVRANFPLSKIEQLAARQDVQFVRPAYAPELDSGAVTSEGDVTQTAGFARTAFGTDGSGVRVGVLSDSVDYLAASQATGDAPPNVVVLAGQSGVPGSGEGTAMIEIVHDLAPGAEIYFATAGNGEASFAQNILNLRAAGCDIIVDDVRYATESPFQDGVIARAVNTVTVDGALYFASAGNSGNKAHGTSGTWEGDFADGGAAGAPVNGRNGNLHLFGTNAFNTITSPGFSVSLFWADPLGASTNDYDLFILDTNGTAVVSSSTTAQTGAQDPFEIVPFPGQGERVVVVKVSGDNRFLHVDSGRGELADNTWGFARGHSAATNAFATAAIDVATAYPNAFTAQNTVEFFSSDGPRRVFYQGDGTHITPGNYSSTGGAVRQYPTLCASDGVVTTVPGFAPFFGTSAAAPHAAAIAALVKSYNTDLTAGQIRNALLSSALDNEAPGVDETGGYGILMAHRALTAAPPPIPLPKLVAVTNFLSLGNGNGRIDFNECNSFDVVLTNIGRATATGVRATLSTTTPGVVIAQPSATYPNMPVGAGGTNIAAFRISTAPYFVCGTPIDFVLTARCDQNTTISQWSIPTGEPLPALRFDSYAVVPIPDNNRVGAYSGIMVSNVDSVISQLTVALHIRHTYDADLVIRLISPGGVTNTLSNRRGFSGQNFGFACSPDSQRTVFDDSAAMSIAQGAPPFLGSFRPEQPLAVYAGTSGTNVNGLWLLHVMDQAGADVGSLQCWTLSFESAACTDGGGECPGSDLSVGMTAQPEPVLVGGLLTYTISITNAGPSSAKNVTASQVLPSGVIYVSSVASQGGTSFGGGIVTCNLGQMNAGAVATATVVVQTTGAGTISSSVNVTSEQPDFNQVNNSAVVISRVQPPTADLSLGLASNPDAISVGDVITYTLSVTNLGPSSVFPVIVTNWYPEGLLVTGQSVSQGTVLSSTGGTLVLGFGSLTNGGRATASISAVATAEGNFQVLAAIAPPLLDPIPLNNIASITTPVGPAADLVIRVTDTPDPVVIGTSLTYRIVVTNQGPSVSTAASLNFTLPLSAVVTSNVTSQGTLTVSNNVVLGKLGTIQSRGSVTIVIAVTPTVQGPLAATASIAGAQPDPNLSNNAVTATTQVSRPFISIIAAGATLTSEEFLPPNGSIDPGELVTISLRLRNAGNVNNTNLVATLQPGTGLDPVAPNNPQTYGVLPAGGTPSGRSFSFRANGNPGQSITAVLQLTDGPNSLPGVAYEFAFPNVFTFAATSEIVIKDNVRALPYPSSITVSGLTGTVGRVTASLVNISHTFPQDINALLTGPGGQKTVLMSGAGAPPLENATITFDDYAATLVPGSSEQIGSGSYRPANYADAGFGPPAPGGPYLSAMSALNGSNPNGTWSLFIEDSADGDQGLIVGGWSLSLTTINPVNQLADISVQASLNETPPGLVASTLTYDFVVTNAGPNNASFVTFTNDLPEGVNFVSANSSRGSVAFADGLVVGNLGPLDAGSSLTVTVALTPTASATGLLTNSASASSVETDLNLANNTGMSVIAVSLPVADLAVTESLVPVPATVGMPLTNIISITNAGPAVALDSVLTYTVPAGATVVSATSTFGSSVIASGKVVGLLGDVPASTPATVTVVLLPSTAVSMTHNVSLQTTSTDPVPANNSASQVTSVLARSPNVVAAGAAVVSEDGLKNGAVDAGETLTVNLQLANNGSADTANLVATLVPSAGVAPVGAAAQSYGVLVNDGTAAAKAFTFKASETGSGSVTATLQLQDGARNLGTVSFVFSLAVNAGFENPAAINIPDRGAANPYPSLINVSGVDGLISKVTVTLRGISHVFPHDLNAVLVSPSGANTLLLSRSGGGRALSNVTIQLDDQASAALPNTAQITNGVYRPSAYEGPVSLRAPAPAAPYGSSLSALNGQSPNGAWLLYVFDDTTGDGGVIAQGWSLQISTVNPVNPVSDLAVRMTSSPASLLAGAELTYKLSVTNLGPAAASDVVVSDTLPIGVGVAFSTATVGTVSISGSLATWTIGNLNVGAGATATLITTPSLGGQLINVAKISGSGTDLNQSNNSAQAVNTVVTPEPARLTAVLTNGTFQLHITAQPGLTYVTEASSTLAGPTWSPVSTNVASPTGTIKVVDEQLPESGPRFYRAVRLGP